MILADHRARASTFLQRVTHGEPLHALYEGGLKFFIYGALYIYARSTKADLTLVRKCSTYARIHCVFEITIGKNEIGIFTAQFKAHFFKHWRGYRGNRLPGRCPSRKGNNWSIRMFHDGGTNFGAKTVDNIQNAFWEADLIQDFTQ